ncbi:hypothetical protein GCM10023205_23200 [Yinghuangia aomiensis]|uniref:LPXTG-motif cell wall anchor domain-containing protein n=1 Tax=Yinghuangia aomiensis TaxID=676205 RepID=A0ABP9H2Q5_9ACTN
MPYGSVSAPGGVLAATGLATGQVWLVVVSLLLVLAGVLLVRLSFRRGRSPFAR